MSSLDNDDVKSEFTQSVNDWTSDEFGEWLKAKEKYGYYEEPEVADWRTDRNNFQYIYYKSNAPHITADFVQHILTVLFQVKDSFKFDCTATNYCSDALNSDLAERLFSKT